MSRYLLAGAAGFIGSHLTEQLLNDGHAVVGLDNYLTGSKFNVEMFSENSNYAFVEADVSKPLPDLGIFDFVLHFASPASPPDYLEFPLETLRVGGVATDLLCELASDQGARFMLASTSEIYGDPLEHPQKETYWGNVNSVGPRSVYDEAKRYAEAVTMAYHTKFDADIRIIRIFNTYGARMRANDGRVVSNLIVQAIANKPLTIYGDGSQTRSFCYVKDEVEGILSVLHADDVEGPVNVGNPNEFTMLELATLVQKLTGTTSQIEHHPLPVDDPTRRRPDISKIQSISGWTPDTTLEDGLIETIAYFRSVAT